MTIKGLISAVVFFLLLAAPAFSGEPPSIEGSFTRIPGKEYRFDGKAVEVVEFLSFYCGSCYEFERHIPVIKGNFPKKIKWKVVPVYWGEASPKPGEAYLLAVEAGKGDEMKKALFHANFVEKKDIGRIEVLESIAAQVGLGFGFSMKLRSGEKAGEAQKAVEKVKEYMVEETPTLIIAGNIATNAHASGHDMDQFRKNTISILKSILGK